MTEAAHAIERAGESTPSARPAPVGFVEARTHDRILGWAWDPGRPEARLGIALVDGERIVARTVADQGRDDLARNGIGDGAHAFGFLLDDGLRSRAATLDVAVMGEEGALIRLPSAQAEPAAVPIQQMQRGLAALAAGQRALLKAVQAPPADRGAELADALAAIAEQQQRIERAVGTLEVFVARLDERLAALASAAPRPAARGGGFVAAAIIGALGLAALGWALAPAFV
ncbi:hypothetical protein [Elioraea sp.]|uniref:hypothetical protein n=1 Tax=Elioraea sp. TaxID=2185103 RepID=UPI0025C2B907|nr:hypothetical protein [Elioraea sp.]